MKRIICIGDSHASFFSGMDRIQPEYPCPAKNMIQALESVRLGPVLAYSLHKNGTTNKGREKLFEKIRECDRDTSSILFCFGEIDCRNHLLKQSEENKRSLEDVVGECVAKYFDVILEIKNMGFEVLVWNVIPTSSLNQNPEYPHYGSHVQRNRCTRYFNSYLGEYCRKNGIVFIDIFDKLVRRDNHTREYFFFDGIHLGQLAMPYFIGRIKRSHPYVTIKLGRKISLFFSFLKTCTIYYLRKVKNLGKSSSNFFSLNKI